jgi:hypothetical protein
MFVVSHFYAACGIDDVSGGSLLGSKVHATLACATVKLLAKSCVLLVICVCSQN